MECPKCGKSVDDSLNPCPECGWDGTAVTVGSDDIEKLWGKTLTPDMEPGMTIKSEPSSSVSRSGVSVKEKNLSPADSTEIPDSDYELISLLGEGGMGVVYTARQASMDRTVALKMIQSGTAFSEGARNKFISEAAVTGDLDHPNIVPVYDLGSDREGALFYAMKHVKGTPWSRIIRNYMLGRNLEILMRTADAVAFAHSKGIIHRDLKPENVMIGDFGEVLVMDWGLAASVKKDGKADYIKGTAGIGGTPSYMAPEMAMGDIELISEKSDVYLLGAILFEIITERAPHSGQDMRACLMAAANNDVISTDKKGELLDIALKSMNTDPTERFESVKDFQEAIRKYQEHSESIEMCERAGQTLKKAIETGEYTEYSRALFGFTEALSLWDDNESAQRGKSETEIAYAGSALKRGDLDLAISLVDENNPEHSEIRNDVLKAQKERESRKKRLRMFRWTTSFLTAAVLLLIAGVWVYVEMEKQKIRDEAAELAQLGEKVLQESGDAETSDNQEKLLIEAQNLFRQSLFLDPENKESKHGFRETSFQHYNVALENKNWRQAREKLDQALQTGMKEKNYNEYLKNLENAENARRKHIEERVRTLIADAASLPRKVLHQAAKLELISLKDKVTVDALIPHISHRHPEAQRLAIETLGWMGDLRVVEKILPYIENYLPDEREVSRSVQESAIIAVSVLAPNDVKIFETIRTRFQREPGVYESLLFENTKEFYQPYARKMADRVTENLKKQKNVSAAAWRDVADMHRSGNGGTAIQCYSNALKTNPQDTESYIRRGVLNTSVGRYNQAELDFAEALKTNPEAWEGLLGMGNSLVRKDKEKALDLLRKALSCVPQNNQTLFNKAKVLVAIGRFLGADDKAEMMKYYNLAVDMCPEYMEARIKRIDYWGNHDEMDKAENECRELLKLIPRNYNLYIQLGAISRNRGRFEDATRHFAKAVEFNPNFYYTYAWLGATRSHTGENEKAIADHTKALHLGPGGIWNAWSHYQRGLAYFEIGEWQKALDDFIRSGELDNTSVRSFVKAGYILNATERTEEAYVYLKKALRYVKVTKETRGEVMFETAKMRLAQGNYTGAIRDAQAFLQMRGQDYVPYLIMGTARGIEGKQKESLLNFRKAFAYLKRDKDNRHVQPVLKSIMELLPEFPIIKTYEETQNLSDPEKLYKRGIFYLATFRSISAEKDLNAYLQSGVELSDEKIFHALYFTSRMRNDFRMMKKVLETWLKSFPDSLDGRSLYVNLLCESPIRRLRDPIKALELARVLADETENENSNILASLSIAFAANLNFKDAMDIMELSLEKTRRDYHKVREEREEKLKKYVREWNKRREISKEELKDI